MDERLRFVARLLDGEQMAPLCAAQTVVICSATNASRNPTRAVNTYAEATASPIPTARRRFAVRV
jgi:hypothetical protein